LFSTERAVLVSRGPFLFFLTEMGFFYAEKKYIFALCSDKQAKNGHFFLFLQDGVGMALVRVPILNIALALFILIPMVSCGEYHETPEKPPLQDDVALPSHSAAELTESLSKSDIAVLGRIDACWVCQFDPWPSVTYSEILAGEITHDVANQLLYIAGVDRRFLPEGGVPIYKSQKEEICFLKKVVADGANGVVFYQVVDIWAATDGDIGLFHDR